MINKLFYSRIEAWLNQSRSDEEFRENSFVFVSLTILIAILSFLLYYNVFIIFIPILALIHGMGVVSGLAGYYFLKNRRSTRTAGIITVTIMTTISLLFIIGTQNREFALAFCFLTPVIAVFILGYKLGSFFSLINFAVVAYFCLTEMQNWHPVPFDTISFIHLTIIYFFLFSISYFYDSGRRHTMRLLKESNLQLKALSTTDVLTGLPNRLKMEELLLNFDEVKWIAMLDVDDFKSVNDNYGHDIGDRVLKVIAKQLANTIGDDGVAGRWGGEEFLIAFYISDVDAIEKKLIELQAKIAAKNFGLERNVTVSCGATPHQSHMHRTAFRRADEALYRAKASGKNCYKLDMTAIGMEALQ
ncbi:GGDEF domain-containing protein [Motilimonas cestriensis]|uniref:diguanylate cyclase n=1 Tax=Motilimonas cestriensis TaxID=2742685 RepID=A0ABS8WDY0_9GAMM|nr:GGDEF domain-containing protein [Motilimonas cestriensis]MCE2596695.1 GGDEF domain-containing protein [Motilimonas cestriensis]